MTTIRDWYSPMHFSAGLGQQANENKKNIEERQKSFNGSAYVDYDRHRTDTTVKADMHEALVQAGNYGKTVAFNGQAPAGLKTGLCETLRNLGN